jgi:hypothetical protein
VQSGPIARSAQRDPLHKRLTSTRPGDERRSGNPWPHALALLLRHVQALITQMAQTAACNRHHRVDRQLCRWLLLRLDRLDGDEIAMAQELIADMLGVRRGRVTASALKLQKAELIRYARGHITVLDRPARESRSCDCYAVVKKEDDRLLLNGLPHWAQEPAWQARFARSRHGPAAARPRPSPPGRPDRQV